MLWLPRSVHTSDCPCLTGLSGLRAFCNLGPAAQLEEAVELFMFAGRPRQALRILNQRLSDAAEPAASDATRGERCAARCRRAVLTYQPLLLSMLLAQPWQRHAEQSGMLPLLQQAPPYRPAPHHPACAHPPCCAAPALHPQARRWRQ